MKLAPITETETQTISVSFRPHRGNLLNQVIQRYEENHPAWEGQYEEVNFEAYCAVCGQKGTGGCEIAYRCIRQKGG